MNFIKKNNFFSNESNSYKYYKFNKQVHLNRLEVFKQAKNKKMIEKESFFIKEKSFSDFIIIKDNFIETKFTVSPCFNLDFSFDLIIDDLDLLEDMFNLKESKTFLLLKNLLFQKIEKEIKKIVLYI